MANQEKNLCIDLSRISEKELVDELTRRRVVSEKKAETLRKEKEIDEWRERPSCQMVGRAYGLSTARPRERNLAFVTVKGNIGYDYDVNMNVCSAVETYFNNSWSNDERKEFATLLYACTRYFINKQFNNPIVAARLMELAGDVSGSKEIKKEIDQARMDRLCEFSLDELKTSVKKEKEHRTLGGYSALKLIEKAIKIKEEKNIKDKKEEIRLPDGVEKELILMKLEGKE